MKQFIGEEINVEFDKEFFLEKKPPCPISFKWREKTFGVNELISSWFDYERKGKKARNMRITHLARARKKGSWGVGRFYFKVKDEFGMGFSNGEEIPVAITTLLSLEILSIQDKISVIASCS